MSSKKKNRQKSEENVSKLNEDENGNESSSSLNEFPYLQIEYAEFTPSFCKCNIGQLIEQPKGVDQNEWIANNFVSFYNHINLLYGVLSDLCTKTTCPIMNGPQNSFYYWIDERNKKLKRSAPEYFDSAMTFIQKILSNDNIFPTRLDKQFAVIFDVLIRKMFRLLYHCISHMYAIHYCQLIEFELHPHLNNLFLHLISFLIKSDLILYENSNVNSIMYSSLSISGQNETRELRLEIQSLQVLYELLAKRWQHVYAQVSTQKKINK